MLGRRCGHIFSAIIIQSFQREHFGGTLKSHDLIPHQTAPGLLTMMYEYESDWEVLKPGFHSTVHRTELPGCNTPVVVKTLRKAVVDSRMAAGHLATDIAQYAIELYKRGVVALPPLEAWIRQDDSDGWSLITVEHYAGRDLRNHLLEVNLEGQLAIIQRILAVLGRLFSHIYGDTLFLETGIDPKPENFASDKPFEQPPVMIDLVPVRFRRLGTALLELPPPRTDEGREASYLRYYHAGAILTVLQTQLCRLLPDQRPMIVSAIAEFARAHSQALGLYLDEFPGTRFSNATSIAEREGILASLNMGGIYGFRDIACHLVHDSGGLYNTVHLERVFAATHFEDELPASQLDEARSILQAMVSRQPITV